MRKIKRLTHNRLQQFLSFNRDTGKFLWKDSVQKWRNGTEAGAICRAVGPLYRLIRLDGVLYKAHRLAWFYEYEQWPSSALDHIDGNGLNNSIKNLRECTMSQNIANSRKHKDNSSGSKGIDWREDKKKWRVRICKNYRTRHVGYFSKISDAELAYSRAAKQDFGEFARTQ